MNRINPTWAIALLITAAAWGASIWIYPRLPATVPVHWNLHGVVDGYGSKATSTLLLPTVMVALLGLFRILPRLSPKSFEASLARTAFDQVVVTVAGLFAFLHGVILLATWQQVTKAPHPINLSRTLFAGSFLALGLIGNVLGKVPRNLYVGVRVPWTLASDRVWNDTHRIAAWAMVGGSLAGFLIIVARGPLVLALAVGIISMLIPIVYSFIHYKRLQRRGLL